MIISVSRRTDIPAFYSNWFFNRVREGFVFVRNPMRFHQVGRISLAQNDVDCFVFWTKNPLPMLDRLHELEGYMYYFQFSLTPYGKDIEQNLPPKNDELLSAFKKLSSIVGADRVIWRYDPILINAKYTLKYHTRAFEKIASELQGYTNKVIISFIDSHYRGAKANINKLSLLDFSDENKILLASELAKVAHGYGLVIETCATSLDFTPLGIKHARCIDDRLISKLLGQKFICKKDKNQRLECGCIASVDIGVYNTCLNGCCYCYANYNPKLVQKNFLNHNPLSPLLLGEVTSEDKIYER